MATVFYWTNRGNPGQRPIYGVHPNQKIIVPEGVASFDVPESPDQILWPNAFGERGAVVDDQGVPSIIAAPILPPKTVIIKKLVKLILDEFNILRALHGLPARTMQQVLNQIEE